MQSLWMLFATFTFSIMGLCIKLASSTYSTSEIVMYRGAVGMLFVFAMMRYNGQPVATRYPWHHLWRGVIGVTAMWLWFYSIGKLPLATAMTLNYMSPIWMAVILFIAGLWQRKTRFEWGLVLAVTMSFLGVIMLLRPSFHADQLLGGIIGLISGVAAAFAYLQVKQLGKLGEPESRVVFYLSVTGMVAGFCGTLLSSGKTGAGMTAWNGHTPKGLLLLLTIGVTAAIAQVAMTRAYQHGKTLVTANLQYSGIIFSSVWGVLFWGDVLSWLSWVGITVIMCSGVFATYYNLRNRSQVQPDSSTVADESDPIKEEI